MTCGLALLAVLSLWGSSTSAFEFLGIRFFEDQSEIDADSVIADPRPYSATLVTSAKGDVEAAIRRNPSQAALIAAGIGFVFGLILSR